MKDYSSQEHGIALLVSVLDGHYLSHLGVEVGMVRETVSIESRISCQLRFVSLAVDRSSSNWVSWGGEMSKANVLREMSDEQLDHELRETQQSLFRIRFQSATERNDTPSNVRKLRQVIARVKTIQRERQSAVAAED